VTDRDWYQCLVAPRRVAVVGASADPAKGGLLRHLLRLGFAGEVIPVNRRAAVIEGLPAVPDVAAIDGPVDLAVVTVPAEAVPAAIRSCADAGVPVAYVVSAGFAELGDRGRALQAEARAEAARTGLRLVGPNTNGLISARSNLVASIMSAVADLDPPLRDDGIAVLTQSGAVGAFLLQGCADAGLGVGTYFSTGNEADLGLEELLGGMVDDPAVRVVLGYVEGLRDGPAFVAAARRARAVGKPVCLLKVGVTEAGAEASASHTAALAGADSVYDGVFRQLGVRRATDLRQLVGAGQALRSAAGRGRRLGLVTISGGLAVMATDALVPRGLHLPGWSDKTAAVLASLLPGYVNVRNPLDTSGALAEDPGLLQTILQTAALDDGIDVLLLALGGSAARQATLAAAVADVAPLLAKPVVVVWVGPHGPPVRALAASGIACFATVEDAVAALDIALGRALPAEAAPAPEVDPAAVATARAIIAAARAQGHAALDEVEGKRILRCFGIPCPGEAVVRDGGDVAAATSSLAMPVVAKICSRRLLHKSDVGGIVLGLADNEAAAAAVTHLRRRAASLGLDDAAIVVQEQLPVGVELIVGASRDTTFGPVVTVGIGGVTTELEPDIQIVLPDASGAEIRQAIDCLRGQKLLDGFRGAAPVPRDALVAVVTRFAALVRDLPEIAEIEINPLVATRDGSRLVAVDALVTLAADG
jgi:acyl-CoA synthetase (NDP forming)